MFHVKRRTWLGAPAPTSALAFGGGSMIGKFRDIAVQPDGLSNPRKTQFSSLSVAANSRAVLVYAVPA